VRLLREVDCWIGKQLRSAPVIADEHKSPDFWGVSCLFAMPITKLMSKLQHRFRITRTRLHLLWTHQRQQVDVPGVSRRRICELRAWF